MLQRLLGSHCIGLFFGIEVRILYILYVFIALWTLPALSGGVVPTIMALLLGAGLLLSVFLHEVGHALSALKEGVPVRAIFLHPLGGMAKLGGTLPGPYSEMQTALAGPAVSLLVMALLFAVGTIGLEPFMEHPAVGGLAVLLGRLAEINLYLALFNLLPVFPLDGGRVLAALMVLRHGVEDGIRRTVRYSILGIILMAAVGVWFLATERASEGWPLLIIAMLLYWQGAQETQARAYVAAYAHTRSVRHEKPMWYPRDHELNGDQVVTRRGWFERWLDERRRRKEARERDDKDARNRRIDEILRKVNHEGIGSLTAEERQFLEDSSRRNRSA